ncbi:slipin family protein [Chitinophaga tropicalis]|uniref:Slipin family protein n=1 Tax=Chitinophaga tropicalis TaxID=2683588 RepID=A0A7K1TXY5_9BACT|nr:slipin family protein [Chitinophaga tropicalis]MVT06972.1 slipin family protein [Chitinophaga tropicalis]
MIQRIRVEAYHKALVFRNNRYVKMLNEGTYWIKAFNTLIHYDMTKPFVPTVDLDILLQDKDLADALEVIDVLENQLALLFENRLFKTVLTPGKHAFWKGIREYTTIIADLGKYEITEPVNKAHLARNELQSYVRMFNVGAYEKGLLYIDGKFDRILEPGIYHFWRNTTTMTVTTADIRQLQMEINGQEILTKDKANIRLNCSIQYKIADIFKTVENKDYEKQLYTLLQLALREQVAGYTLDELLDKRETLSTQVMSAVKEKTQSLGVALLDCGIRDVILPGDMKEILNQVLMAEKKAQANIIMRREETASTRSLLNTAKLMEENEMLFKLKEMEYVEKIADKISNISVNGAGDIVGQLKQIFVPVKKG